MLANHTRLVPQPSNVGCWYNGSIPIVTVSTVSSSFGATGAASPAGATEASRPAQSASTAGATSRRKPRCLVMTGFPSPGDGGRRFPPSLGRDASDAVPGRPDFRTALVRRWLPGQCDRDQHEEWWDALAECAADALAAFPAEREP